jgi:hypothetical protein
MKVPGYRVLGVGGGDPELAQALAAEHRRVERGGGREVRDRDRDVVEHCYRMRIASPNE